MIPYAFGENNYFVLGVHHDVLIIIPKCFSLSHRIFVIYFCLKMFVCFFLDNVFVVYSFLGDSDIIISLMITKEGVEIKVKATI